MTRSERTTRTASSETKIIRHVMSGRHSLRQLSSFIHTVEVLSALLLPREFSSNSRIRGTEKLWIVESRRFTNRSGSGRWPLFSTIACCGKAVDEVGTRGGRRACSWVGSHERCEVKPEHCGQRDSISGVGRHVMHSLPASVRPGVFSVFAPAAGASAFEAAIP